MESVTPVAKVTGRAVQTAVALLTLRSRSLAPQPGRAAVLADCDGADVADVLEVLEVMTSGMLAALPAGLGEEMLLRVGLLGARWEYGGGDG